MQNEDIDKLKKGVETDKAQCQAEITRWQAQAGQWQAKLQECDAAVNAQREKLKQLDGVLAWLNALPPDPPRDAGKPK